MADSPSPPGPSAAPPTGASPVYFDRASAERIRDSTLFVERMVRGGTPTLRRGVPGSVVSGTLAVTDGVIGPGTATSPASGSATLRAWDGTTLSADTGDSVAVFNYHDKTIASGSLVFLSWALGAWWVTDVRSCSNLS